MGPSLQEVNRDAQVKKPADAGFLTWGPSRSHEFITHTEVIHRGLPKLHRQTQLMAENRLPFGIQDNPAHMQRKPLPIMQQIQILPVNDRAGQYGAVNDSNARAREPSNLRNLEPETHDEPPSCPIDPLNLARLLQLSARSIPGICHRVALMCKT
jgi:hypothetical protein